MAAALVWVGTCGQGAKMKSRTIFLVIFGVFLLSASLVLTDDAGNEAEDDNVEYLDDEIEDSNESDLDVKEDNNVLVLTTANFDAVINSHDIILVEFYAPWCGHCKSLAPEYEKAATALKQNDPPVALAKVDATVEGDLASRYGVTGYPTLKFFKQGEVNEYDGPRQEIGIIEYMKEKADPDWKPPPSEVVVLTSENFDEFINNEELSLVEFYAPWCGHCKKLAPEYEKAAQYLKEDGIKLAKVDATEEKDVAGRYDVTGYPTMVVFRNGKSYEYKGQRNSANDLTQYMRGQQGTATKEQESLKQLQKALSKDDVTVVGFFNSAADDSFSKYEIFTNNVRDDYILLHSYDEASRNHYKVNAGSVVVFAAERFYSKYESKWSIFDITEETTGEDIVGFVKSHEVPLVGHMTTANKDKRFLKEGRKALVIFFCDVDWGFDGRVVAEQNRQKALRFAKDYKDLTFAITDEKDSANQFKEFGFEDSGEDMNIGILSPGGAKYPMEPMEDGFDEDAVRDFLDSFQKGKLKPKLKSQRPPKKQGPVTVVVGDTFEKIVMDKKKDVLIEFYAPWCGHCKTLAPKYAELAKKLKKEKNLVIAKFDATANEAPEQFVVKGFPTIYFAAANRKADPIQYSGANEVDDLTSFIKENSAASFRKLKEEL